MNLAILFFMRDGDPEKAMRLAGYNDRYIKVNAETFFERPTVKDILTIKERGNAKIATVKDIHAFWSSVMNSENKDIKERLRASELLAKAKGAFDNEF